MRSARLRHTHHISRLHLGVVALAVSMLASSAGCSFDESGIKHDGSTPADAALADAPPADAPPVICEAGQISCDGHVLVTCNESGTSITEEPCLLCEESSGTAQCLYASNIPAEVYATCASEDHALVPPAGSVVTIAKPPDGEIQLQCNMGCGNGADAIRASHVVSGVGAWFCLSNVFIRADVTVNYTGHIAEPIIWLVDGPVDIAGTVNLRGSGATIDTGGAPGPGGFAGAALSDGAGAMGQGPCAGSGGTEETSAGGDGGGGGGGGAFGGKGGNGGEGKTPDGNKATGGTGGTVCDSPTLAPLHGGSGGGGGADGACDMCGWPSGGGGGALGIAARMPISISMRGTLDASGGNGFGRKANPGLGQGGGGGGGAGGALLLEAPMLSVAGKLVVDGGNGGDGAAGDGGNGATAGSMNGGDGKNAGGGDNGQGGSGGGGGGGRIRLNTPDGSFECDNGFVSPDGACTHGSLPTEITPMPTP